MYIIEMHHKTRAFAQVILEKGDENKTYDEFANYRTITNHAGDIDPKFCRWCAILRNQKIVR